MSSDAKVSVIVINRNGARWLGEAIRSVLAQTHADLELVMIDDGSTDGSREIIEEFARSDRRVLPIYSASSQGAGGARNLGIEAASGAYLSFLDGDDRMQADTLARQLAAFAAAQQRRPEVQLMCSDAYNIDEAGRRFSRYMPREWWGVTADDGAPPWTAPSTWFLRRDCPARFKPEWRVSEAGPYLDQVQRAGGFAYCGEPLIDYRIRRSSATITSARDMLRGATAAKETIARGGDWDHPVYPSDVPEPALAAVIAWKYGRIAKAAAVNGRPLVAAGALLVAAAAAPRPTFTKLASELRRLAGGGLARRRRAARPAEKSADDGPSADAGPSATARAFGKASISQAAVGPTAVMPPYLPKQG